MRRLTSLLFPRLDVGRHSIRNPCKRYISDRSEASYSRRIYCSDGNVELGPPTFTFFTDSVCLTMKLRHDDNLGYKVMLLTGMTRAKGETKSFEKKSRVSTVLPLEEANKLEGMLSSSKTEPVTLHGLGGGNVVFTLNSDYVSLKLCPSFISGVDENILPASQNSSKINVNFVGGSNEHSLLLHAMRELKQYQQ
ncbi:hypothetical protein BgAZ_302080 [Babesia gibsoni]|uniref:Uncharacterized protein n=1 Tax=Babesia gibsoni TaxID=33632 RepID=A0AAD8LS56_BABGI|nr:hypothetical protein BgAZ_302080 [Babesia gibsoni]